MGLFYYATNTFQCKLKKKFQINKLSKKERERGNKETCFYFILYNNILFSPSNSLSSRTRSPPFFFISEHYTTTTTTTNTAKT
jgi:hypothetical protein